MSSTVPTAGAAKVTKSTAATSTSATTPARAKISTPPVAKSGVAAKATPPKSTGATKSGVSTPTDEQGDSLATGRSKRTPRASAALRASLESLETGKSPGREGPMSPPRKVPKLGGDAPNSSFSNSRTKQTPSKATSAIAETSTPTTAHTPPASARATRSTTPIPLASGASSSQNSLETPQPTTPAPVAPPEPTPQPVSLWVTAPHSSTPGTVMFTPAIAHPNLAPAAYSLCPRPVPAPAPVSAPTTSVAPPSGETLASTSSTTTETSTTTPVAPKTEVSNAMEVDAPKTEPSVAPVHPSAPKPPATATPAPAVVVKPHPSISQLQRMYQSGQPIAPPKVATAATRQGHLSVPAYSTAQLRQYHHRSNQSGTSEPGSLGFSAHYKRHVAESGRFAQQARVFIIDNGAYAAKMGFSTDLNPEVIHNMVGKPKAAKRKFSGAELGLVHGAYAPLAHPKPTKGGSSSSSTLPPTHLPNSVPKTEGGVVCADFRALSITRPHDRGYVLNWDLQTEIWALDQVFRRKYATSATAGAKRGSTSISSATGSASASNATGEIGDPSSIPEAASHCLVLTEAHVSPWNLTQKLIEHVYGTLSFGSLFVCSSAFLCMLQHRFAQSYTGGNGIIYTSAGESGFSSDAKSDAPNGTSHHNASSTAHSNGVNETKTLPSPAQNLCCIVVEVGYSFTHVTPFFEDYKLNYAIKRLNVGGKVMTNYLRELVSFRHFNMMDQTYLMSLIKERLCYVSTSFAQDLKTSRIKNNAIKKHYILPDQTNSILGFVYGTAPTAADIGKKTTTTSSSSAMEVDNDASATQNSTSKNSALDAVPDDAQILTLCNERFAVPEALFHPSDVGLRQAGLAEVIYQSIIACPEYLREAFCSNIVLAGASAAIPGLAERLVIELRPLLPTHYPLRIYAPSSPGNLAWHGGKYLAAQRAEWLDSVAVSKLEYQESGLHLPKHRFSLF